MTFLAKFWRLTVSTILTVKHDEDNGMLFEFYSTAATRNLVKVERKMDGAQ